MVAKFKKRILSIDGGGIRGIIPAMVLNYIEKKTGKPIASMFDLIAGTSTGGILALGLTKGNSDLSAPMYTCAELVDLYRDPERGGKIFTEFIPGSLDDVVQPKFTSKYRQKVLEELLKDSKIEEAIKEVYITSYDIELRVPVFFTSNPKSESNNILENNDYSRTLCKGFKMVDAAMATSAAPTFFQPYKTKSTETKLDSTDYALIDGGVFANNPTALARTQVISSHARDNNGEELQQDQILVVSLGTGTMRRKYEYRDAKKWGQLKWLTPLIDVLLDGQSEAVSYQLYQLMETEGENKNYYRFQVKLDGDDGHDRMDNTSPKNIEYLKCLGNNLITSEKSQKDLNELCEILTAEY